MANMDNLNAHIRAAHEGVKYPCQQCLHQATTKGDLDNHRRSIHEGKNILVGDVSIKQQQKEI